MREFACENCGKTFQSSPDADGNLDCPYCGAALYLPEAASCLPPGFMVGGFRIIEFLASGGMGDVYIAEQLSVKRKVALKILKSQKGADANETLNFIEEAKNTARFTHHNIVMALDAGESNGIYYIAMQYEDGRTIEAMLENGRIFTAREAVSIALKIADALKSIWNKHQMFHKDIKPGNIIINSDGEPMILDMGIAQHFGESSITEGRIEGSPFYISPEHACGAALTWSTDLYSLGATLYHMLTGIVPYDDKSIDVILQKHASEPFPDPAEKTPWVVVPPPVVALLRVMMGKTPAERFDSWESFIEEAKKVEFLLENPPEAADAPPAGNTPHAGTNNIAPRGGKKTFFIVMAFASALALAAAAGAGWHYLKASQKIEMAGKYVESAKKHTSAASFDPRTAEKLLDAAVIKNAGFFKSKKLDSEISGARLALRKQNEAFAAESASVNKNLTLVNAKLKSAAKTLKAIRAAHSARTPGGSLVDSFKADAADAESILDGMKAVFPANAAKIERVKKYALRLRTHTLPGLLNAERSAKAAQGRREQLRVENEKKRKLREARESERLRAENEKKAAAARKAAVEAGRLKAIKDYGLTLEKAMESIRAGYVVFSQKHDYSRLAGVLARPREFKKDALFAAQNSAFDSWLASMRGMASASAALWKAVSDSGKEFKQLQLSSPKTGKKMFIGLVRHGNIILHDGGIVNERTPVDSLLKRDFNFYIRHVAEKKKMTGALYGFYLGLGEFGEARVNAKTPFEMAELSLVAKSFLRALASGKDAPDAKELSEKYGFSMEIRNFIKNELQKNE